MRIVDFDKKHVGQAAELAVQSYEEERKSVPDLPSINVIPNLEHFAENELGVTAFDGDTMLGYLCAWGPFDDPFACNPGTKGVWSPAHANCAVGDYKGRIYKEMYQAIAEKWVSGGALIHAITLYAHDETAVNAFFTYGFGLRCIDAVKLIERHDVESLDNISFMELPYGDMGEIADINNHLIKHLAKSPCFFNYPHHLKTPEIILDEAAKEGIRYFIAKDRDKIVSYVKIGSDGEHFATKATDMMNICGAYLLPEYRSKGIFDNLLYYSENVLANEGYVRLGVDFESFNPTAYGFWLKHFTAYTSSVVRRIDEGNK